MAPAEIMLSGHCKCTTISYTSTCLPSELGNCHCLTCRRLSGSPFLTFADFPTTAITWTRGSGSSLTRTRYSDVAERAHCAACGSPVYMTYHHRPDLICMVAGTIDEASVRGGGGVVPSVRHHIFLGEKAGWFALPEDGLERFEGHTPAFQAGLDAAAAEEGEEKKKE